MSRYHFERLSVESASHLMAETTRKYSHVLNVLVFEPGPLGLEGGGIDVDAIARGIGSRLDLVPRFRQRLKWIPYDDYPVWVDDGEFNIEYHLRHTALPHPGDRDKLHVLAARLMSTRLHRSRPMWECWVAEGLDDGRFALISKIHNCMIESDSGADLFQALLTGDAEEPLREPPAFEPRSVPSGLELLLEDVAERIRLPFRSLDRLRKSPGGLRDRRDDLVRRLQATAKLFGYTVVPPRMTPINGVVGPHRRIHTEELPLGPVLEAHRRFDCTVHDIVLAIVCRALRSYLRSHLVHPASLDVRVATPVQVSAGEGSDRIEEWVIDLPVWQDDLVATIATIRDRTRAANEDNPALGASSLFSMARWGGSRTLALAARTMAGHSGVNLSVLNIPGAASELYFMGARLVEAYGVSPLRGHQGLSVATTSYDDKLFVGINADFDLVPDVADLGSLMRDALTELGQVRPRRRGRLKAVEAS